MNRTFKCLCKSCNKTFYSNSNTTLYCDNCLEHKVCYDCGTQTENLYLKTDTHIHLCNKCLNKYSRVCINTCKICGKEFITTSNRCFYCNNCLKHPKCSKCGQIIKNKFVTINDNKKYFCSRACSNKYNAKIRSASGNCIICGKYNDNRDALGQGIECGCSKQHSLKIYEDNQKPGKCSFCGEYSKIRDRLARCPKCAKEWYLKHNNTEKMKLAAAKNGNENLCSNPNFIMKNNVKFYKDKELNQLSEDILAGKENINNYPGFKIKLGRIIYHNIDILNDEKIFFENDFQIKDNVEYILDHSAEQYVLKDDFFKQFNNKLKLQNINSELQKFINLGFTLEPIITINDSNWNREQTDKYLVDKGYNWIVYIKLFKGKPFIVGKTGTRKVSRSPIDFDFKIYNENNLDDHNYAGQGRRFIKEYYPNVKFMDFDKILVKNFNNETETLKYERHIAKTYNLFES